MNRTITHLLLALSVVLSASLHSMARSSPKGLYLQNANGNMDASKGKRAEDQTKSQGAKSNGNHNSTGAQNSNPKDTQNTSEGIGRRTVNDELAQEKDNLQVRVDAALQRASIVARNTSDDSVKDRFRELNGDVHKFRMDLEKAEKSELQASAERIENISWEIETKAQSALRSDLLTYGNIVSTLSLLLTFLTLGGLLYLFSALRAQLRPLEEAQKRSGQSIEKLRQVLGETKKYAESVGANLSRVQDDLGLRIESAKRSSEEAKKLARAVEFAPAASVEPLRTEMRPDPIDPEPSFPATVAEYLNHIGENRKKGVEADFRTNLLVPATDGSAPFIFVEDADGSGAGIILPRPRLQRSQEFASLYKGYYYCTDPSAGEVYIIEPAIVERDGGGWRLSHPGRMEIR